MKEDDDKFLPLSVTIEPTAREAILEELDLGDSFAVMIKLSVSNDIGSTESQAYNITMLEESEIIILFN